MLRAKEILFSTTRDKASLSTTLSARLVLGSSVCYDDGILLADAPLVLAQLKGQMCSAIEHHVYGTARQRLAALEAQVLRIAGKAYGDHQAIMSGFDSVRQALEFDNGDK